MFADENSLDMHKIMHQYAQMNPHIALSDIAFLMDIPCPQELDRGPAPEITDSIN